MCLFFMGENKHILQFTFFSFFNFFSFFLSRILTDKMNKIRLTKVFCVYKEILFSTVLFRFKESEKKNQFYSHLFFELIIKIAEKYDIKIFKNVNKMVHFDSELGENKLKVKRDKKKKLLLVFIFNFQNNL